MYWETKEGQQIRVADMDTRHLANSLKMVKRKIASITEKMDSIADASWYFEHEVSCEPYNAYGSLMRVRARWEEMMVALDKELEKRGEYANEQERN